MPYHGETRSTAAVGKTEHAAGAGDTAKEVLRPGDLDTVEFGSADSGAVSEDAVMDCLRILERDYPGMNVVIWEREGAADLKQLAAALGNGRFLVVTRDFLERMGRDAREFERCRTVLKEMAGRLAQSGSASVSEGVCLDASGKRTWVVPAAGRQDSGLKKITPGETGLPGSPAKQSRESEWNLRKTSAASYAVSGHYGSLARAGTRAQVQKVLGDVHRSIGNLKLAACLGDDEERIKAGRAIRSLQKLLSRGNKKIRRLDGESSLKRQKKRAEKERKEKKVLQIRLEMKKRRSARYGADYRLVREGLADNCWILGAAKHRTWEEMRAEQALTVEAGIGDGLGFAGLDGGGVGAFHASDVVISDGGSF
ncbi:putative uncharacterized protein [Hungatella hathewayi CAG:224]|nr:putative uncharacterized protein [Hungatella hathewayi CAG:224]